MNDKPVIKPEDLLHLLKHLTNGLLETIPGCSKTLGHKLLGIDRPVFRWIDVLIEVVRRNHLVKGCLIFPVGFV